MPSTPAAPSKPFQRYSRSVRIKPLRILSYNSCGSKKEDQNNLIEEEKLAEDHFKDTTRRSEC